MLSFFLNSIHTDTNIGMIECFQHEHIRKLAAIGPALLEDMRSLPFQAGYYPRRTLASIPLNNSMNRAQGTYNDPRLSSFQRSGRNPPRVVVQSGDFADPDDFNLCHGQAKRMGVLSAALTSMSLCKSTRNHQLCYNVLALACSQVKSTDICRYAGPSQDPAVNSLRTPYTMIDAYKRIAGVYFQDEKLLCNKRDCQCHMAVNVNDEINRRIAEVEDDTLCGICLVCLKDSTIDFTSYAYGYPICNNHLDYHHGAV